MFFEKLSQFRIEMSIVYFFEPAKRSTRDFAGGGDFFDPFVFCKFIIITLDFGRPVAACIAEIRKVEPFERPCGERRKEKIGLFDGASTTARYYSIL